MGQDFVKDVFDQMPAGSYDERNRKLSPITNNLHFLMGLTLDHLPANARILCVGVGTGAEILGLAQKFPQWQFVGVDPSVTLLEDCRKNLERENLTARCQLFRGYLEEYEDSQPFDGALCILVAHFIRDLDKRRDLFQKIASHLKPEGTFIHAEISFDLDSPEFPAVLEGWKAMHIFSGMSPEKATQMNDVIRKQLPILPPKVTGQMIREAGFPTPAIFFQSLLIHGWVARRGS